MKIRFETAIADVIAFNRFHYTNSPAWRKQLWVQSLLLPAVLGVVLLLLLVANAIGDHAPDPSVLLVMSGCIGTTWLGLSIGWFFYIRWHLNSALIRNARKFLAEGSNRTMYGWREMEIVAGRLMLYTELLEISMDLRAIEKIVGNEDYAYVYIGSVSAYMIPLHGYHEDEHREFVAELREAWDNCEAPMRAADDSPRRRQANEGIVERDW